MAAGYAAAAAWAVGCLASSSCITSLPQANETFAFVGNVTHYAKVWLNISPEIRAYLEEGRLQRRIRWLQQVGWCWD